MAEDAKKQSVFQNRSATRTFTLRPRTGSKEPYHVGPGETVEANDPAEAALLASYHEFQDLSKMVPKVDPNAEVQRKLDEALAENARLREENGALKAPPARGGKKGS